MSLQFQEERLHHYSTLSKKEEKHGSPLNPIEQLKKKHRLQHKDFRIIIAGDNGNGKTSLSAVEGELENPKTFIDNPQFAVDHQIHFFARSWIAELGVLPKYAVNIYDEPAQSGGHHREFMSEANIIVTKTVATARYLRLNIPINIPFIDMLDLDIRKLCQIYVYCYDQGKAEVYTIHNPKFGGDPWYTKIIDEFTWNMPNQKFWKLYETKKRLTEDEQYKKYGYTLGKKERDEKSDEEMLDLLRQHKGDVVDDTTGKVNISNSQAVLGVGRDKGGRLARTYQLELPPVIPKPKPDKPKKEK